MEVPTMDYSKANRRWSDRIARENSVNVSTRTGGYESRNSRGAVQGKVTSLPSPYELKKLVLEFMTHKAAADANTECRLYTSTSPRNRFLIPQATSKQLGWSLGGQFPTKSDEARVRTPPKAVVTGLYNWNRSFVPVERERDPADHNVGYVTLLGDNSHPTKGRSHSLVDCRRASEDSLKQTTPQPLPGVNLPGDYHIRPHEWSYLISKVPRAPCSDEPTREPVSTIPKSGSAISIPTTVVRHVDQTLRAHMAKNREFMNRIGSNKWYHPLTSNDVSAYGDAYVKAMQCGPFNKTQLLVSR